jgi:hypothetical protein
MSSGLLSVVAALVALTVSVQDAPSAPKVVYNRITDESVVSLAIPLDDGVTSNSLMLVGAFQGQKSPARPTFLNLIYYHSRRADFGIDPDIDGMNELVFLLDDKTRMRLKRSDYSNKISLRNLWEESQYAVTVSQLSRIGSATSSEFAGFGEFALSSQQREEVLRFAAYFSSTASRR